MPVFFRTLWEKRILFGDNGGWRFWVRQRLLTHFFMKFFKKVVDFDFFCIS